MEIRKFLLHSLMNYTVHVWCECAVCLTVHGSFFKVNKFGGIPYFLSLSDPYYPSECVFPL